MPSPCRSRQQKRPRPLRGWLSPFRFPCRGFEGSASFWLSSRPRRGRGQILFGEMQDDLKAFRVPVFDLKVPSGGQRPGLPDRLEQAAVVLERNLRPEMPGLLVEKKEVSLQADDGFLVGQLLEDDEVFPEAALLPAEIQDEGPLERQKKNPGLGAHEVARAVLQEAEKSFFPSGRGEDAVEINDLRPVDFLALPGFCLGRQVREVRRGRRRSLVEAGEDSLHPPEIPALTFLYKGDAQAAFLH